MRYELAKQFLRDVNKAFDVGLPADKATYNLVFGFGRRCDEDSDLHLLYNTSMLLRRVLTATPVYIDEMTDAIERRITSLGVENVSDLIGMSALEVIEQMQRLSDAIRMLEGQE